MKWSLVRKNLSDLREYEKNARLLTVDQYDQLCTSIDKFGLIDKPIITPDGMIIGGHQRLKALEDLGYAQVECWVPDRDLTDKEIEELNIRLNRNHGEFDFEMLANSFDVDDLVMWGFSDLEFNSCAEDIGSSDEEKTEDKKQCKLCPNCGHEF